MTKTPSVFDTFMAELEAQSAATLARREREAADPRMNALAEYLAIFADPLPRHGMAGFGDVIGQCMSARHWRNLRAESLRLARKQQLFGHAPSVRFWLVKAAGQRKTEKLYRAAERRAEYRTLIDGAFDLKQLQAAE